MEKLLNPWLPEEEEVEEEDGSGGGGKEFGSSNQSEVQVIRALFILWFLEEALDDDDGYSVVVGKKSDDDYGGGEKELVTFGLSNQSEVDVTRSSFISWFATKAASIFLGLKEEYIQDLENLLPAEEDDDVYAVLSTDMVLNDRFCKINSYLMIWWINKAGSVFEMETGNNRRFVNPLPEEDDDDDDTAVLAVASLEAESAVKLVGSTDLFCKIRDDLLEDFEELKICSIVGMAGIGKTALARKIIKDPLISSKFECCIFLRMGPEYQWKETVQALLAQMPGGDKILMEEDVDLSGSLVEILQDRKCLIVLDDIWNPDFPSIYDLILCGSLSQSAILFTTRIYGAARNDKILREGSFYHVPFMNKEESWELFCGKIFGEKDFPRELEKAGKIIAENCEGLPLLILAVAGLLSKAEKTAEYWSKVAANKTNSIFVDAYKQVSGIVYPSYYYLPRHLKACFLYLAAFPQNDEVRVCTLINLWNADGFLGVSHRFLLARVNDLMKQIVFNNVALGTQWNYSTKILQVWSLHSVFWYLCKREARNENFLRVLNSYRDASVEGIKSQRRLSIYKNVILSIKDARDSIASISALQSFLCMGPYLQYQVPICLGDLRVLKVLDVLSIRFYEFPTEVAKLVQLRYLALTCNGNLSPSISNLWGLQCLILHQHLNIKSSISRSYVPVEIWELKELEHLQIMGRNLPDPPPGTVLKKLLLLLDVGVHTCTKSVLESIPNLGKLRVQIELMPGDAEPLRFCDDTSHLEGQMALQFVVVNPELNFKNVAPPALVSYSSLRKLTLSGFGYPWIDMHKIAELHFLEELKLKCYAFQGEKWQAIENEFERLKYLSIEDTDLVEWTTSDLSFRRIKYLTIKNCYRLLELPELSRLRKIQVVDCNPSAVTWAKQMATTYCNVHIVSTWLGDGKR